LDGKSDFGNAGYLWTKQAFAKLTACYILPTEIKMLRIFLKLLARRMSGVLKMFNFTLMALEPIT